MKKIFFIFLFIWLVLTLIPFVFIDTETWFWYWISLNSPLTFLIHNLSFEVPLPTPILVLSISIVNGSIYSLIISLIIRFFKKFKEKKPT